MKPHNLPNTQGVLVFHNLLEAQQNGFEAYDRTSDGYLMRTRTDGGWALALVQVAAETVSSR